MVTPADKHAAQTLLDLFVEVAKVQKKPFPETGSADFKELVLHIDLGLAIMKVVVPIVVEEVMRAYEARKPSPLDDGGF